MIRTMLIILATTATPAAWAQQPAGPSAPERQTDKGECRHSSSKPLRAIEEKETACIAEARKRNAALRLVKMIAVSGDAGRDRQFVRLSWDPRDAPWTDHAAFQCFFEQDRMATAAFDAVLIADPPTPDSRLQRERELRRSLQTDDGLRLSR